MKNKQERENLANLEQNLRAYGQLQRAELHIFLCVQGLQCYAAAMSEYGPHPLNTEADS